MTGSETGIVCMWEYSLGRLLKVVNRMPPTLQMDKAPGSQRTKSKFLVYVVFPKLI